MIIEPQKHLDGMACRTLITRYVTGEKAMAMSNALRQRLFRQRRDDGIPKVVYRKPIDRRAAPQRWADATADLLSILETYQAWRDGMPAGISESGTAQKLDAILELRDAVEELASADLPKGFGRD